MSTPHRLRIEKVIRAPRDRVWEAWIDPVQRRRWWCAAPEYACSVCDLDPFVGGRYRINMEKGGEEWVTVGEFVELDEPHRMRFSWSWERPADGVKDTLVTVELHDEVVDGRPGTRLVLTHEDFRDEADVREHVGGWTGCLESLAAFCR